MSGNSTEDGGNAAGGSSVGLALGLTFFFLLLVIIAGLITYKYYPKIRRLVNFGRRESQGKEECTVSPQAGSHHYTSVTLEPDHTSAVQTPVYENLTAQAAAAKTSAAHPRKSSVPPEEDWYMQSDTTDDPIYNNCTAFKPSPPDPQDEDVYIVPDS